MVGHGIAVAAIGRVLVGAEQVARSRQAEPPGGAAGQHHRLGLHDQELGGAGVDGDGPCDAPVRVLEEPGRHVAVGDRDLEPAQLPVEHLLDVVPFGHRQHVGPHVVDLAHVVLAGAVLLELHPELIEVLDHRKRPLRVGHHRLLVDDAVVGDRDLLHVLLGSGVARHDGVVEPVHAHADRAGALHVGLLHQQHPQLRVGLLGFDRGHRAAGAAADDEEVGLDDVELRAGIAHEEDSLGRAPATAARSRKDDDQAIMPPAACAPQWRRASARRPLGRELAGRPKGRSRGRARRRNRGSRRSRRADRS